MRGGGLFFLGPTKYTNYMNKQSQQWNLRHLYQSISDPAIKTDFKKIDQKIATIKKHRNKITRLEATEFLALLKDWEEVEKRLYKIDLFGSLLEATNTGQPAVTRFVKEIEEKITSRSIELLFIETKLAKLKSKQWQKYLLDPILEPYRNLLLKLAEQAKHTLSEPEERILAEKNQTSKLALSRLYSLTTDTLTIEWEGETVPFEVVLNHFHHHNPKIRRKAALQVSQTLENNRLTTPTILNDLIRDKIITDRLRHYHFPEQERLAADQIEEPQVELMALSSERHYRLVDRYYRRKKIILKTPKLYWWDRYAPLPAFTTKIDKSKAIKLVVESFNQFSPLLGETASRVISNQHIDWLPSSTKRGGAFCAAGPDSVLPYVLLNYTNSPRDVMTLAHELGHAIHDILARENNNFFQAHPALPMAEIASVFGETLVFTKLISSPIDQTDKLALLMSFIEDRFATVFRQTAMFRFEKALHRQKLTGGELSKDQIDELWHTTMKRPFEQSLTYTNEHKNSWMYVSHIFQTPFYVYSYAYAQLCVLAIYQRYKNENDSFVPIYLDLLKAGGSDTPANLLAKAGFEVDKPAFWDQGFQVIESFILEFERLADKLK